MDAETAVQAGGMGPLVWWAETPAPVHPAGARAWRSCDHPLWETCELFSMFQGGRQCDAPRAGVRAQLKDLL